MQERDPDAFTKMLIAIEAKVSFSDPIQLSHCEDVMSIWFRFLCHVSSTFRSSECGINFQAHNDTIQGFDPGLTLLPYKPSVSQHKM